MRNRQAGVPIEVAYAAAKSELEQALILSAYTRSRYMSQGFQDEQVDLFVTEQFSLCMGK